MPGILLLFVLLVLSAFFAGTEVALVSISRIKVQRYLTEGRRGAKSLLWLKRRPRKMIITILVGNNVVNIGASALTTVIATKAFGSAAVGIAIGILMLLLLVFGEIIPKSIAQAQAGRFALLVARPIKLLARVLAPLIWVLDTISNAIQQFSGVPTETETLNELELKTMIEFGVQKAVIEPEEQYIINRAMRFSDTLVEDVMTPASRIFAFKANLPAGSVIGPFLESGFSRVPVFQGSIQNILGIVLIKEVMAARVNRDSTTLEQLAHKPIFITSGTPIDDVFKIFQKKRMHLGIVRDADDVVLGLVTLEDLLEELVGEIDDEHDRQHTIQDGLEESGDKREVGLAEPQETVAKSR